MHFGGKSKAASKSVPSDASPSLASAIELNRIECPADGEPKTIFSKKFIESPMKDEKMFYHNKRVTLYKTEMCRSFNEVGFCKYGDRCQFCHSKEELREVQRHPKYKTEICKTFWNDGSCPYGSRCCFVHLENLELVNRVIGDQDKWSRQDARAPAKYQPRDGGRSMHRLKKNSLWRATRHDRGGPTSSAEQACSVDLRNLHHSDAAQKAHKTDHGCSNKGASARQGCCPSSDSTDAAGDFDTVAISTTEECSSSTTKACSNSVAGDLLANKADASTLLFESTQDNAAIRAMDAPGKSADSTTRVSCIKENYSPPGIILGQACKTCFRSGTGDDEPLGTSPPIEYNKIEDTPERSVPSHSDSLHAVEVRSLENAMGVPGLPQESGSTGHLYNSTIEALIEARSFESDAFFAHNGAFPGTKLMMLEEIHIKDYQSVWEKNYIARWKSDPIFFILQDIKDIRY